MTTTYKKLASYFLTRGETSGTFSGYYYGNDEDSSTLPYDFNSAKLDLGFISNVSYSVEAIAIQPDGKILIGGNFVSINGKTRNRIARLNTDGTLDSSFLGSGANNTVNAIAIQPDGDIIIGGLFTSVNGVTRNRIARLKKDGTLDSGAFNPSANGSVNAIAILPDNKIFIGGDFTNVYGVAINRIARLNADGSLDTSFDEGNGANDSVKSVVVQPDGKILVSGDFTTIYNTNRRRIARFNSDGSFDDTFSRNTASAGFDNTVWAMAVQTDGKIVIGGDFTSGESNFNLGRIARLDKNGAMEFVEWPTTPKFAPIADNAVLAIAIQPDGKILIAGNFTSIDGVPRNRIARLNADGTLDNNFDFGVNEIATSLALQDDNKILIGGNFTSTDAGARKFITRIKEVVDNSPYVLAYTVPENTQVILKTIFATNHNDFPVFNDIAILPEQDQENGISEKHYYVWDNLIDSNDYENIESSVTLSSGDQIYVYSSTDEDISYNIFGVEITP